MQKTRFALAVVLLLIISSVAHAQAAPAAPTVSYATFMQLDDQARARTFNRITPDNRAALVLTHVFRWMEVNRSYLSDEQRRVLNDFIHVIEPPLFRIPGERDTLEWREELAARARRLFSPAEIRQAFTIYADYIPPQPPHAPLGRIKRDPDVWR